MNHQLTCTAFLAGLAIAASSSSNGAEVDVTNANGTVSEQLLNSNGGLSSTGFVGNSANGVSLWLRARDKSADPGLLSGTTFTVEKSVAEAGNMRIDFQFTPRTDDIVPEGTGEGYNGARNYYLMLQWDNDPTAGVNYATAPMYIVFDDDDGDGFFVKSPNGDIDDRNDLGTSGPGVFESGDDPEELFGDASWDDGDSLVIDGTTVRGGNTVDFTWDGTGEPADWVVVNSWKPEWIPGGGYETPTEAGDYNVKLTVFDETDTENALHSIEATVTVTPEPGSLALLAVAGVGLMGRRRSA